VTLVNDKLKSDVNTIGWHVLGIAGDRTTPNVAHTVGLTLNYGRPEVVVVGLSMAVLMSIVQDLGRRVAEGHRLDAISELHGVVDGYPVRFAKVLPIAHARFLPGADEYYGDRSFEALQCLWPDKLGRFPDDANVDAKCASVQPHLGDLQNAPLYASWAFEDAYVVACITTKHVINGSRPILLVTHDEDDGGWQFLCDTTNETADGRVVSLISIVAQDRSLSALADLPIGWEAKREHVGASWIRSKSSDVESLR
jgi:hypothetical protein